MDTTTTAKHSFAGTRRVMSLWEVAHRWAGLHPKGTCPWKLPLTVNDILCTLSDAQSAHQLASIDDNEGLIRIESTYRDWRTFRPKDEAKWDCSGADRLDAFYQETRQEAYRHNHQMDKSHSIFDRLGIGWRYYKRMRVERNDLAYWSLDHSFPFPDFWFSPAEKQELLDHYHLEPLLQERLDEMEEEGVNITYRTTQETFEELSSLPILDAAEADMARVKAEAEIDGIWSKLRSTQKDRLICQRIATVLWEENPHFTIPDIANHPNLMKFGLSRETITEKTIRNWIKHLDTRSEEERIGRPSSRKPTIYK